MNSIEDKKFFEDLENIQSTNKITNFLKSKKKRTAKKTKKIPKIGSASLKELSQDGNAAQSFKSMKSYILGSLDISSDGSEFNSYEISSNSSAKSVVSGGRIQPNLNKKKFQEDEDEGEYLENEAFNGFMQKQSPFSFKNSIFFSCPINKVNMNR